MTDVLPTASTVPIAEPTVAYTQARWDFSASSRVINGVPDVVIAFSWVPCRVLKDGTVEEASESKRRHFALSTIRKADGTLSVPGQTLLTLVRGLLALAS